MKKKSLVSLFVLVAIIFSLLFGSVRGLDIYASLRGIRQALEWRGGAFMMVKPGLDIVLFAFPAKGGTWGFAGLTRAGDPIKNLLTYINANQTDYTSMAQFVSALEKEGWKYVTSEALPASLVASLQSVPVYLMSIGARTMVSPLLVPLLLPTHPLQEPAQVDS